MKKTLAALAVLGAFAGTSLAADVTLYGIIDTGFNWTQTKTTGSEAVDSFSMKSGQNSGSRIGFKGTEELGNGLVVGFNLENSFNSDDGTLDAAGRFFHREAILFVRGGFGEIALGRTGSLDAGTGTYNLIGTKATPMGLGWDTVGKESKIFMEGSRFDNTITYKSPTFAGVTVYAQASLKKDNKANEIPAVTHKVTVEGPDGDEELTVVDTAATAGQEGSSDADRYYAIGAMGNFGALNGGLVVSTTDYSRVTMNANNVNDDSLAVTGYVNYDFGMIKPMIAVQYFDGGVVTTYTKDIAASKKGYGVVAGFTAPLAGGKAYFTAGWNDAKSIELAGVKKDDINAAMVGAAYEYPLSKRTKVYTAAGYSQEKVKYGVEAKTVKTQTTEVMAGLVHSF